ncbi:DUF4304 domain-containing protein [Agromyces sp. NPDC056379]|uniref:DUF4304 domain-containing protein n=1 Tax=unclassified Agromyces TaxID=2639701 RepID=UPI0035DF77C4
MAQTTIEAPVDHLRRLMSTRNEIQVAMDAWLNGAGFRKHKGAWYRRTDEVVTVVDLQKSQYGPQYYLNIGLWFRAIEDLQFPKPVACHVVNRLASELSGFASDDLSRLLDLEAAVPDRGIRLRNLLDTHFVPLLGVFQDAASLRSPRGELFLSRSGIRSPALALLNRESR